MFKHAYHGGPHVDVLTTSGKDPLKDWKNEGKILKAYDKDMKQSIFTLAETSKL